jgi:hypothetical protein
MDTTIEMPDAEKAWALFKQLNETTALLWELYHLEFSFLNQREPKPLNPDLLPF